MSTIKRLIESEVPTAQVVDKASSNSLNTGGVPAEKLDTYIFLILQELDPSRQLSYLKGIHQTLQEYDGHVSLFPDNQYEIDYGEATNDPEFPKKLKASSAEYLKLEGKI